MICRKESKAWQPGMWSETQKVQRVKVPVIMPRDRKQAAFKGQKSAAACNHLPATIDDLPLELLAMVLTFLPIYDCLLTTDLVNKSFHHASKHPMLWDGSSCQWLFLVCDMQVADAVKFFVKHQCTPSFYMRLYRLSPASFRVLPQLTSVRTLNLSCLSPILVPGVFEWLPSLIQLESLTVHGGNEQEQFDTFVFPAMARLNTVELHSGLLRTILNMDTAHLPLLSDITISCNNLHTSSFPESLTRLKLDTSSCSTHVLANIARLPKLQSLQGCGAVDVLSQPDLHFTSTITMLLFYSKLTSQARDNLCQLTNLTALYVSGSDLSAADVEVIASLPSLTDFRTSEFQGLSDTDLAPFRHATSLRHLSVQRPTPSSLPYFAHPSLVSLDLSYSSHITSIAPLAVCVNLTAFQSGVYLSEQDGDVLSGLTKLEKLDVVVSSEACLACICRLPRLKQLRVDSPNRDLMTPAALQTLSGLAPTIERLTLPSSAHTQTMVSEVSKLKKLDYFSTYSSLSSEQVSLLRNNLPRILEIVHAGSSIFRSFVSLLPE